MTRIVFYGARRKFFVFQLLLCSTVAAAFGPQARADEFQYTITWNSMTLQFTVPAIATSNGNPVPVSDITVLGSRCISGNPNLTVNGLYSATFFSVGQFGSPLICNTPGSPGFPSDLLLLDATLAFAPKGPGTYPFIASDELFDLTDPQVSQPRLRDDTASLGPLTITEVPEPRTFILLGSGLLAVVCAARWNRFW